MPLKKEEAQLTKAIDPIGPESHGYGMKSSRLLPTAAILSLASCAQITSTLQEPITSDYNPLDGPSAPSVRNKSFQPTGPSYKPGQWVETAMPNATFFRKIPAGNATADQVLTRGIPLKVISTKGSYLKVELEGGSVGYVPTIMVAEPSSSTDTSPFLPPPPSAPLQRSNSDTFAPPSIQPLPSSSPGSSVIPPPSNYNDSSSSAFTPNPLGNKSEVVIPTSPSPVVELPSPSSAPSSIPAPVAPIDQSIGIE